MEDLTYSNLGNKITKRVGHGEFDQTSSLSDFVKYETEGLITEYEIIIAFCNDLKSVLDKDSIKEMIKDILTIENNLNILSKKHFVRFELPDLEEFYKKLSPVLLQSVYENVDGSFDIDSVLHGWMESLRIAIEEELYLWQEKNL
ncbi:hypothetical protein HBN50_13500 [Halobacteriovorax sp. GB3]|uniref:hypothetical protein n=1 Tax=Halobacteriovorax sp. GB3 TaxID=2719615 RepID=UPI00235E6229|nr:hypothetical protein [Halobacteriovorax sp. GB3]MDD0854122.1 hypothetical protein [Halobacteriovorax sp. GB3]